MTESTIAEIRQREDQRLAALLSGEPDRLRPFLDDQLVHIHSNGMVDGKESYAQGIASKWEFLKIQRDPYTVEIFGDVAITTGVFHQQIRFRETGQIVDMSSIGTQLWVKRPGIGWVQRSFQGTKLA